MDWVTAVAVSSRNGEAGGLSGEPPPPQAAIPAPNARASSSRPSVRLDFMMYPYVCRITGHSAPPIPPRP
jgi:hypothetical protein